MCATDMVDAVRWIRAPSNVISQTRKAIDVESLRLNFVRNFQKDRSTKIVYTLTFGKEEVKLIGYIPFKCSFVALSDYTPKELGVRLLFHTTPIHYRLKTPGSEVWIVENSDEIYGEFLFEGDLDVAGTNVLCETVSLSGGLLYTRLSLSSRGSGSISIKNRRGGGGYLMIVFLGRDDLFTLNACDGVIAWGACQISFSLSVMQVDSVAKDKVYILFSYKRR
jgi:hypothetical protein